MERMGRFGFRKQRGGDALTQFVGKLDVGHKVGEGLEWKRGDLGELRVDGKLVQLHEGDSARDLLQRVNRVIGAAARTEPVATALQRWGAPDAVRIEDEPVVSPRIREEVPAYYAVHRDGRRELVISSLGLIKDEPVPLGLAATAFRAAPRELRLPFVFAHEVGHHMVEASGLRDRGEFEELEERFESSAAKVSLYASANIDEFIAESFATYAMMPAEFRAFDPKTADIFDRVLHKPSEAWANATRELRRGLFPWERTVAIGATGELLGRYETETDPPSLSAALAEGAALVSSDGTNVTITAADRAPTFGMAKGMRRVFSGHSEGTRRLRLVGEGGKVREVSYPAGEDQFLDLDEVFGEGSTPDWWFSVPTGALTLAWDEDAHPRHPAGSSEGGRFAPAGASGATSAAIEKAKRGIKSFGKAGVAKQIVDSYIRNGTPLNAIGSWDDFAFEDDVIADEVASSIGDADTYDEVLAWVRGNPPELRAHMREYRGELPPGAAKEAEKQGTHAGKMLAEEVTDGEVVALLSQPENLWTEIVGVDGHPSDLASRTMGEGFSSFGVTGEELDEYEDAKVAAFKGALRERAATLKNRIENEQVEVPKAFPLAGPTDGAERGSQQAILAKYAAPASMEDLVPRGVVKPAVAALSVAQGFTGPDGWKPNEDAHKAVSDFTAGWGKCEALRDGTDPRAAALDAEIARVEPLTPDGITAWRGMHNIPADTMARLVDPSTTEIEWSAPSSTTLEAGTARKFAENAYDDPRMKVDPTRMLTNNQVLIEIKNAKGAVPWGMSKNRNEYEMIIRAGSRLKITERRREPWSKFGRNGDARSFERLVLVGEFVPAGAASASDDEERVKLSAAEEPSDARLRALRFVDVDASVVGSRVVVGPRRGAPAKSRKLTAIRSFGDMSPLEEYAHDAALASAREVRRLVDLIPSLVVRGMTAEDIAAAIGTVEMAFEGDEALEGLVEHVYRARLTAMDAAIGAAGIEVALRDVKSGAIRLEARDARDVELNPEGLGQEDFVPKPWESVVEAFKQRVNVRRWVYDRLFPRERAKAFTVVRAMSARVIAVAHNTLTETIEKGLDLRHFGKLLRENIALAGLTIGPGATPWYLETVFRTNVLSAYTEGRKTIFREVAEARPFWGWRATKDDRTRETHWVCHGLAMRHDDPLWEWIGPPADYNCFLPGTEIQGRIVGASRARYSGQAVELVTKEGRRLSVTSQHPVLTPTGFVAARDVREGDQLVCQRADVHGPLPAVGEHDAPAKVEEVFGALAHALEPTIARPGSDDFHGEAAFFVGDVEVVGTYGDLSRGLQSARAKRIRDLGLEAPDALLSGRGDLGARLVGGSDAEARRGHLGTGLGGHDVAEPGGPEQCPLAVGPAAPTDGVVSSGDLPGPSIGAHGGPLQELRLGLASKLDARLTERSSERPTPDTDLVGELLQRFPGNVALDDVVEVRHFDFSGHVFDLETSVGWVVAGGVFSSNCRCVIVAMNEKQARDRDFTIVDGTDQRFVDLAESGFAGESLAMGAGHADLLLWDPNQPRDPAGTSTGGQWTSGGGGEPSAKEAEARSTLREFERRFNPETAPLANIREALANVAIESASDALIAQRLKEILERREAQGRAAREAVARHEAEHARRRVSEGGSENENDRAAKVAFDEEQVRAAARRERAEQALAATLERFKDLSITPVPMSDLELAKDGTLHGALRAGLFEVRSYTDLTDKLTEEMSKRAAAELVRRAALPADTAGMALELNNMLMRSALFDAIEEDLDIGEALKMDMDEIVESQEVREAIRRGLSEEFRPAWNTDEAVDKAIERLRDEHLPQWLSEKAGEYDGSVPLSWTNDATIAGEEAGREAAELQGDLDDDMDPDLYLETGGSPWGVTRTEQEYFSEAAANAYRARIEERRSEVGDGEDLYLDNDEIEAITEGDSYAGRVVGRDGRTVELAVGEKVSGKVVGTLKVDLWTDDEGRKVASDPSFFLDPSEQDKGAGKDVLRHAFAGMKEMGFDRIETQAVQIGRYAWATLGFVWDNQMAAYVAEKLPRFLKENGAGNISGELIINYVEQIARRPELVAGINLNGGKQGKAFLLDPATPSWTGVLPMNKADRWRIARERMWIPEGGFKKEPKTMSARANNGSQDWLEAWADSVPTIDLIESMREVLGADVLAHGMAEAELLLWDPNQPRDPAGTSTGGQWTSAAGEGQAPLPGLEGAAEPREQGLARVKRAATHARFIDALTSKGREKGDIQAWKSGDQPWDRLIKIMEGDDNDPESVEIREYALNYRGELPPVVREFVLGDARDAADTEIEELQSRPIGEVREPKPEAVLGVRGDLALIPAVNDLHRETALKEVRAYIEARKAAAADPDRAKVFADLAKKTAKGYGASELMSEADGAIWEHLEFENNDVPMIQSISIALLADGENMYLDLPNGVDRLFPEDVPHIFGGEDGMQEAIYARIEATKQDAPTPDEWIEAATEKGASDGASAEESDDWVASAIEDYSSDPPHWWGATGDEEKAYLAAYEEAMGSERLIDVEGFGDLDDIGNVSVATMSGAADTDDEPGPGYPKHPPPSAFGSGWLEYAKGVGAAQHENLRAKFPQAEKAISAAYDFSAHWSECDELREGTHASSKILDDAIRFAEETTPPVTLYRGLHDMSRESFDALLEGDEVEIGKMSSTSSNLDVAKDFAIDRHKDHRTDGKTPYAAVLVMRGAKGLSVANISRHASEAEFIMRAGSRFVVTDRMRGNIGKRQVLVLAGEWAAAPSEEKRSLAVKPPAVEPKKPKRPEDTPAERRMKFTSTKVELRGGVAKIVD
jgi:GNAT superfamily N-acetyltransferase